MKRFFTEHPHTVNETYWQHMRVAMSFAAGAFITSLGVFIHALLPFCFKATATNFVVKWAAISSRRRPEQFKKRLNTMERH